MDKLFFIGGVIGLGVILNKKGFTHAEVAIAVVSSALISVSAVSLMKTPDDKESLITIIK